MYFPKLSHHITLIIPIFSLFGKKIHNFLWQIEHKEWKYKYHSFGNGYNSLIFWRKFYESMSFWSWKYVLYSSRIFRRARRQFVVGFNEVILPYHHNRMYNLCIPIQWKYTISNLAPLGDDGKGNLGLVDVGHLLQRLRLETAEATGETDITNSPCSNSINQTSSPPDKEQIINLGKHLF